MLTRYFEAIEISELYKLKELQPAFFVFPQGKIIWNS